MKITKSLTVLVLLASIIISCKKKDSTPPTPAPPVVITPALGIAYEGGIIFYLDSTGKHGLIAATGDESIAAAWGCQGTFCGASGTANGTGAQNTTAILTACDSTGIAAQLCKGSSLAGYSDWYLPSKNELDLMRTNLYLKSIGSLSNSYYWSSTEDSANNAWFEYFGTGFQDVYGKSNQFYVRRARAF